MSLIRRRFAGCILIFAMICALVPLVKPATSAKHRFLQQQQLDRKQNVLGKADRLMDVQIQSPDLLPANANDIIVLRGEVHLHQHRGLAAKVSQVQLHWELPAQAILVQGEVNPILHTNAGETQSFEIAVRGLSWQQANPVILLHARTLLGSQSVGASGVFPDENLKDIADVSLRQRAASAKPHAAPVLATSDLLQF